VFEESRLPLRVWTFAIWRAASSKKGCSALELSRQMQIGYRSALFVLRRIRHGLGNDQPVKLTGTVEVDETYVGGKLRYTGPRSKRGRPGPFDRKTPVVGMVERGGKARLQVMERITWDGMREAMLEAIDRRARLMTDDLPLYRPIGEAFAGGHGVTRHARKEYAVPGTDIHSNTIEGVFSLLKRGVMGTFHSVSKKHLPNYLNEFEFRYNTRKVDDGQRVTAAIQAMDGKRLTYRESVDNPPYLAGPKQAPAPF
jgi:hypothetical protein